MSRGRIADGDKRALAEAYVEFRPLVVKVLRERARHPADVDDLVQDAFMQLPECCRSCAAATSLGGCVVTAVVQACQDFDRLRATSDPGPRNRSRTRRQLAPGEVEAIRDPALNPEEAAAMRERTHHLSELVLRLSPVDQRLLIAREFAGIRPAALAAQFGLTTKAVEGRTTRARRQVEALAASSPLADVFAALPKWGQGAGMSRWSRRRRSGQDVSNPLSTTRTA